MRGPPAAPLIALWLVAGSPRSALGAPAPEAEDRPEAEPEASADPTAPAPASEDRPEAKPEASADPTAPASQVRPTSEPEASGDPKDSSPVPRDETDAEPEASADPSARSQSSGPLGRPPAATPGDPTAPAPASDDRPPSEPEASADPSARSKRSGPSRGTPNAATPGDTIEVTADLPWYRRPPSRPFQADAPPGAWTLSGGDIERMPGAAADPARALQAVPGVHAANLRSTALSVRGGAPDETIWVVEDLPLLSPRSSGLLLSRIDALFIDELTLHAGAQPAAVPSSLGGAAHVRLLDPDDRRVTWTGELSPYLGRGVVNAPIGRPGSGNALWVGGRRTLLEPSLWALSQVGAIAPQTARVQDVAARARLALHPVHDLHLTALFGEGLTRSDEPPTGLDLLPQDRTTTLLLAARHQARLGPDVTLSTLLGATRETQRIDLDPEDQRLDRRERVTGRSALVAALGPHRVEVGGELSRTGIGALGTYRDPRTRPPFVAVPWRRLDPPRTDVNERLVWTEVAGFADLTLALGPVTVRPGARVTSILDGAATLVWSEPRLSARWNQGGTAISGQIASMAQLARDPLDLVGRSAGPLRPARALVADLTVQQALSESTALRLDGWARRLDALLVWPGPRAPAQREGQGRAVGLDVRLIHVAEGSRIALGGGLHHVRRQSPLAPFDGAQVEPSWAVPWSVVAQAASATRGRVPIELGASILVRAGVAEIPLSYQAVDDEIRFIPDYTRQERAPMRGRVGLRASRRIVLVDRAELSAFADVIVPFGPLGTTLTGGAVDPETGAVDPPVTTRTRDLPLVPWVGLRARL